MTHVPPKSKIYRHFRLFGWHIYISSRRLRTRQPHDDKSINCRQVRKARWQLSGHICEGCGVELPAFGRMLRLLPAGAPGRNKLERVRILCGDCYRQAQIDGEFFDRLKEKGGAL